MAGKLETEPQKWLRNLVCSFCWNSTSHSVLLTLNGKDERVDDSDLVAVPRMVFVNNQLHELRTSCCELPFVANSTSFANEMNAITSFQSIINSSSAILQ